MQEILPTPKNLYYVIIDNVEEEEEEKTEEEEGRRRNEDEAKTTKSSFVLWEHSFIFREKNLIVGQFRII